MRTIDLHPVSWAQLQRRRERLPHALLVCGQRGIGKFELALAFAAALLCERPAASGEACGRCLACGWVADGHHPDLRLLQPEALAPATDAAPAGQDGETSRKKPSEQITIDQVRGLDDFLHVGTHRQGARVVLLHPAEAMNRATANALLKSLEEPIPSTLFLLVSDEPSQLLPTIRSRCQLVALRRPEAALARRWLDEAGVRDPDRWLALSGGSPLLARDLASTSERALLEAVLAELARGSEVEPLAAAAAVDQAVRADKRPAALRRTLDWVQKWLFDLVLAKAGLSPRYFVDQAAALQRVGELADAHRLLAFNRKALEYRLSCRQPVNGRLFLEDFFIAYAQVFARA
ncbi:DNA polymerase III subunit delta' [Accumulibacter sp.]|uniref:DNA polymerase III subunit delta' n=1 Tax=Accumulibacter sp. TaxID=2053492 RepID=UPI0025E07AAC|nr:DNA polymerase III subunit delta' [Accumulibacter sp.]MCM8594569.1 DNA polymerase III subunit delta' [Accumulibacter sp.]MCM8627417.1 DNA polymerase III subunit delta' [Accumulibacter sp.]MDS4048715.1 DNA polymerase III subunit delta' [Accumulibacter sp.]